MCESIAGKIRFEVYLDSGYPVKQLYVTSFITTSLL